MSTEFITNQEKLLADVVNNIMPSAKNLYFLVGYFYFSGFEEIYKNVGDKDIKILVGLEIENDLKQRVKEYELIRQDNISRGEIRKNYFDGIVKIFNDTDVFDTKYKQEAFKIFLEKIKNGTLEIRKTRDPNHSKLYIFENNDTHSQGGEFPGTVITGSSNLSSSGLRNRFESNVVMRDKNSFYAAHGMFNELWNEAVSIADRNNINDFLYNVIEKIWLDKSPNPFLLYVRVLEEFFSQKEAGFLKLPNQITRGKFVNLKYQEDAVKRALEIIQKHNGLIIADVVGLGKSIIASCVAHNLNMKSIVVAPPHLVKQWEDYRYDFEFHAKVYSSGKINQAFLECDDEPKLIIIDEAHKYRNELTADYADLHKLCQRNKVILLSATPFNNNPRDVFSMIRLFQIPTRSTIQTVDNLSAQFKDLISEYRRIQEEQKRNGKNKEAIRARIQEVAGKIRNILYPLVIRRSRLDLEAIEEYKEDLRHQKISFPDVKDPEILEYELGKLSQLYEDTLEMISPEIEPGAFQGTRYKPISYIVPKFRQEIANRVGIEENLLIQTQVNVAQFMRRLLVRRFESSIFAFQRTLDSIIHSSEQILDWYEKFGKVPIYKKGNLPDLDSLIDSTGEDLEEELAEINLDGQLKKYEEKGLWYIFKNEINADFVNDLKQDIRALKDIRKQWFDRGMPDDPKTEGFIRIIKESLSKEPDRKIVVFSEFADTADYLYKQLKNKVKVFKYSSNDSSEVNKTIIRENFDAGSSTQKNDYDILIATDAISEGFNLHRAGIIFNYDIPYNPTRVIQRVGRINRINKKVFDQLLIYNFFPTATGERETRVKQISTLKIAMVHALFGEDIKVLTKDEELQSHFADQFRESYNSQEELSPETKYEDYIRKLRLSQPDIVKEAMNLPKRVRIKREVNKNHKGVLVFGKKGHEYAFKFGTKPGECVSLNIAEGLSLFEAEASEQAQPITDKFNSIYEPIKDKLFLKRTEVAFNQGKREAANKVEVLIKLLPDKVDYLKDLLMVIKELDSLPDRYAKLIRKINEKTLEEDFEELQKQVPHNYLTNIIQRVKNIDEEEESLILSEELE